MGAGRKYQLPFLFPIGVLITTCLSSKNCTKLKHVAIATMVARGETMENVIIALFFVACFGYLAFIEIKSWIKNGHSALF